MLQMLGLNVLAQENKREEVTASGIVIPTTVNIDKSGLVRAKVISVGTGEYQHGVFVTPTLGVGDEVLVDKNFAKILKDGESEFLIISHSNVLGKVV